MKNYHYFLFDLDGTVTDPGEGITNSVMYVLQRFGIHEGTEGNSIDLSAPRWQIPSGSFMDFRRTRRKKGSGFTGNITAKKEYLRISFIRE